MDRASKDNATKQMQMQLQRRAERMRHEEMYPISSYDSLYNRGRDPCDDVPIEVMQIRDERLQLRDEQLQLEEMQLRDEKMQLEIMQLRDEKLQLKMENDILWKKLSQRDYQIHLMEEAIAHYDAKPVVKAWSCKDDGNAHAWEHQGKLYARNFTNDVWHRKANGVVTTWAGVYLPAEDRIDETAAEPLYADEPCCNDTTWACEMCTLINPHTLRSCQMCGTEKTFVSFLPASHDDCKYDA